MPTRRLTWPLASQYVFLSAIQGSVGAGCTLPAVSIARELIACSPAAGLRQSLYQNTQANSPPAPSSSVAGPPGPSSTRTSTRAIGAPQAAPTTRYVPSLSVTLAGADLSRARPTEL